MKSKFRIIKGLLKGCQYAKKEKKIPYVYFLNGREDWEFSSKGVMARTGGSFEPIWYPNAVQVAAPICNKPPRPEATRACGPHTLCALLALVLTPEQSAILDVLPKEGRL